MFVQVAWINYAVFIILAFALLIALEIHTRACLFNFVSCGGDKLAQALTELFHGEIQQDLGSRFQDMTALCSSLYQRQNATREDLDVCNQCTQQAGSCFTLSGLLLAAMLTALFATCLPCFYFCCFASSDEHLKHNEAEKLKAAKEARLNA